MTARPRPPSPLQRADEAAAAGGWTEVEGLAARALAGDPRAREWSLRRGEALVMLGRPEEGLPLLEGRGAAEGRWQHARGLGLASLGRRAEAAEALAQAVAAEPGQLLWRIRLGRALSQSWRLEEAESCWAEVLERRPGEGEAVLGRAAALHRLGRDAEAWAQLGPRWERVPALVDLGAPVLAGVAVALGREEEALGRLAAVGPEGPALWWARGRLWEGRRRWAEAFAAHSRSQALRPRRWDEAGERAELEALRAALPRLQGLRPEGGGRGPLFIVGMPRSGTTLVEQILAGHSGVSAGGERGCLARAARTLPAPWPSALLEEGHRRAMATRLLQELPPGPPLPTDKLPHNHRYLALAALTLPGARALWLRRDRDATLISCWFHLFDSAVPLATDLPGLARQHALHLEWLGMASELLPVEEVELEGLIAGWPGTGERLLGALGLGVEPACLRPEQSPRRVQTAAWAQVQRPVSPQGIERSRGCAELLAAALR